MFDLKMPFSTSLDSDGLWVANHCGMALVEPHPIRARALNVLRPSTGWEEVFLGVDFRVILEAIHKIPRRDARCDAHQCWRWHGNRPQVGAVDGCSPRSASDLRTFLELVGPRYCVLAGAFGDLHFPLLCGIQRLRAFRELTQCPGLAYALVNSALRCNREPEGVLQAVAISATRRRRQLAVQVGFPESTVRILSRVVPSALTTTNIDRLRAGLARPEVVRVVRHLPRITEAIVRIVGTPRLFEHASARLLLDAAEQPTPGDVPNLASRMAETLSMMDQFAPRAVPDRFRSMAHLLTEHSRYCGSFAKGELGDILRFRFPAPPVRVDDPDLFEPITGPEALVSESICQQNCVGSVEFARRIAEGEIYCYKTTGRWGLERVTFTVTKGWDPTRKRDYIWLLDHVEASRGRTPHPRTIRSIQSFLERCQQLPCEGCEQPI